LKHLKILTGGYKTMSMLDEMSNKQEEFVPELPEGFEMAVEPPKRGLGIDMSFLKSETGAGDLAEYIYHPFNFNNSKPVARILRGATGMFGNINLAIADILLGIFEMNKENTKDKQKGKMSDDDLFGYGDVS
jgi:hypothetical protein